MTLLNNNLNTFKLNILNTSHRELTNKINMIGLDFSNFYIYIKTKTKKKICVFPIDPKMLTLTLTFFMPKKIDRQNPEIRLCFRVCFRIQK
jgi:hypothetical protein